MTEPAENAASEKPVAEMSFEEAMRALETVVSQLERGDVELEQSITLYERVFASGVHRAGSWKNYGIALNNVGRIGEALDAWKMALDIDPQIFDPETAKEITEKYERRRAGRR